MKYFLAFFLFLSLSISVHAQNIGGIGAQLLIDTAGGSTMPRIMALVARSPADTFLKATDFIYTVNDKSTKNMTIEEVVGMIRGEAGTTVKITVTDTKDGKRPRTYNLIRVGIQGATNPAATDPTAAFNEWGDNQVGVLRMKKYTIVKTFTASCGNRFFNFEADARQYHVLVMTMQTSKDGANFTTTAHVFDNDNEAGATSLSPIENKQAGTMIINQLSGDVTFKKSCIGVVNAKVNGDAAKCGGIYVVIYR